MFPDATREPSCYDAGSGNGVASDLRTRGWAEEALAAYEQAIRLGPNNARAYYNHYNQGTVLQAIGQFNEALAAYERAIRLNPNDADAYYNQGNVHQELGRLGEAEQAFRKARALRSQS
ncbi:tetratricopeptide repeat protein [Ktedonobacter racemifer]|uniref:TPR repeat-containing protein n=1 Tax=Ktedonobacter racemifer DSM 44963 TaxID=485913 RepID=D6U887_KTERA|nr:tetratricopeptide repeat protein [Ktedonobacter racemifer]EFH80098.1 TPR repeat-containing protein [Ktedonobacter racemifer DSM 44963]